jgi:hypothetical protein
MYTKSDIEVVCVDGVVKAKIILPQSDDQFYILRDNEDETDFKNMTMKEAVDEMGMNIHEALMEDYSPKAVSVKKFDTFTNNSVFLIPPQMFNNSIIEFIMEPNI